MRRRVLVLLCALAAAVPAAAQEGEAPIERVTFEEAVRRALSNNPTIRQAASGILRAQALLQQTRATALPALNANLSANIIGPVPEFGGQSIVPRTQANTSLAFSAPLLTPVRWAQRTQAADQVTVAERVTNDVRKEIAVATAEAYLQVIAMRRVLELNEQARDNARAHYDYARQRYEGGLGSKLNALRAQQELSADEAIVESARFGVRRAQEALGVLVAADVPIDAGPEPVFEIPPDSQPAAVTVAGALPPVPAARSDIRLLNQQLFAAQRVVNDSWLDYLPSVTGIFAPQLLTPSGLFAPSRSWSFGVLFSVPVFEGGQRRGAARERQSQLDSYRAELSQREREARSQVRTATEAIRSADRALASARSSAQQAAEVVSISDIAFRAGATTNIEVIDAQRRARDAETTAAIAEDAARRARLDLLVALGQFPK